MLSWHRGRIAGEMSMGKVLGFVWGNLLIFQVEFVQGMSRVDIQGKEMFVVCLEKFSGDYKSLCD